MSTAYRPQATEGSLRQSFPLLRGARGVSCHPRENGDPVISPLERGEGCVVSSRTPKGSLWDLFRDLSPHNHKKTPAQSRGFQFLLKLQCHCEELPQGVTWQSISNTHLASARLGRKKIGPPSIHAKAQTNEGPSDRGTKDRDRMPSVQGTNNRYLLTARKRQ